MARFAVNCFIALVWLVAVSESARMGYFWFKDNTATYYPEGGSEAEILKVGSGTSEAGNDYIHYIPGPEAPANQGSAMWLFNIEAQPSYACVLTHSEEDVPRSGIIIATDSGNGHTKYWGGKKVRTFIFQRIGTENGILGNWAQYVISCLDAGDVMIADEDYTSLITLMAIKPECEMRMHDFKPKKSDKILNDFCLLAMFYMFAAVG